MGSKEYEMYAALTRGQCEIVNALTRIADILIEMLATDTVPVRYGKWMPLERSEGKVFCSNCKKAFDWDTEAQYYDYCPSCGAKMNDKYVTLHYEDIHFIDEDAENAFYESLAEEILEDDWDD